MSSELSLYHFAPSSPSRATLMCLRTLGLDPQIVSLNLFKKEQLNEDFIKLNPQHCVPTLKDGDFVIWESRAIAGYLATKYGKDDTLYPKEPHKRALVDRLLYFDLGTFYAKIRAIAYPVIFMGKTTVAPEDKKAMNDALSFMETFLEGKKYIAGDNYTIADISLIASASTLVSIGWSLDEHPKVKAWYKLCSETIPGFEENMEGATVFGEAVRKNLEPGQI